MQMTRAVEEQQKARAEARQRTREDVAQLRKLAEERFSTESKAYDILTNMRAMSSVESPSTSRPTSPTSPETSEQVFEAAPDAGIPSGSYSSTPASLDAPALTPRLAQELSQSERSAADQSMPSESLQVRTAAGTVENVVVDSAADPLFSPKGEELPLLPLGSQPIVTESVQPDVQVAFSSLDPAAGAMPQNFSAIDTRERSLNSVPLSAMPVIQEGFGEEPSQVVRSSETIPALTIEALDGMPNLPQRTAESPLQAEVMEQPAFLSNVAVGMLEPAPRLGVLEEAALISNEPFVAAQPASVLGLMEQPADISGGPFVSAEPAPTLGLMEQSVGIVNEPSVSSQPAPALVVMEPPAAIANVTLGSDGLSQGRGLIDTPNEVSNVKLGAVGNVLAPVVTEQPVARANIDDFQKDYDNPQRFKQRMANREQLYATGVVQEKSDGLEAAKVPLLDKAGQLPAPAPVARSLPKPAEPVPQAQEEEDLSLQHQMYEFLEGHTTFGRCFLILSIFIVLINYACFVVHEEDSLDVASFQDILDMVENFSVLFFTIEYILRLWTCVEMFPDHRSRSCIGLLGLRIRWLFTNFYSLCDLLSIVPWYMDLFTPGDTFRNTQWIRVVRVLKLLPEDIPYSDIWNKSYKLLMAGGFVGFTLWVICASLYYMFERDNDDMEDRFKSIPAAMYFSLLNFFGEFPLADSHSLGGRYVAVFIQVVGVAVIAIPAGALGNAFSDVIDDLDKDDDDSSDEGGGDGDANTAGDGADSGTKYAARGSTESFKTRGIKETLVRALDGKSTTPISLPFQLGEVSLTDALPTTICCLSVASSIFFLVKNTRLHPTGDLAVTMALFNVVDKLASFALACDYFIHWYVAVVKGPGYWWAYVSSATGFVDFFCWFPGLVSYFLPRHQTLGLWLYSFHILRILKLEPYINAFSTFKRIMIRTSTAFLLTGAVALVLWLECSAIMYYLERHNDADGMASDDDNDPRTWYYRTVSGSMWLTLLNLTGEAPLCDYTAGGRVMTAFIGLFGVGFVSIPIGLLGNAFQDELDPGDDDDDKEVQIDKAELKILEDAAKFDDSARELTRREKIFKFLQGSATNQWEDLNPWEGRAVVFERLIFLGIFLSAIETVFETMPSWDQTIQDNDLSLTIFQTIVVFLFTMEYCLRYYSAPEEPHWKSKGYITDQACRWAYLTSFSSIVDLLAILPFYLTMLGSSLADEYDGQLRMLRVFRLLTLDKYIPSVSLISRIFKNNTKQFVHAFYAMTCLWFIFATLLWLTERDDHTVVDTMTQGERYGSVVSGAPYILVHLTGDYPLIDYTIKARIVLFFALLGAVGVVAVPTGLLASGFQNELKARRLEEMKAKNACYSKIEKVILGWIHRRRFLKTVKGAVALKKENIARRELARKESPMMRKMAEHLNGKTKFGQMWCLMMPILAALNTLAVILESVEPIKEALGSTFLDGFEMVSVLLFTAGYLMQVYAAKAMPKFCFKRRNYILSFWGIVDLITVLPWWVQESMVLLSMLGLQGLNADAFIFRVFRLLRLLQLEDFLSAFTLLDDAWAQCRETMVATGFLALLVWVCGAVLFYNFEKGNPKFDGDPFGTLPMSMYYTGIFLGGEWALIDFTPGGRDRKSVV